MSPTVRTLRHGPLSFTADEVGSGRDTVLCLHGFPDHRATWRHQLPALVAAGYRVVAPNMRGYEPSSQPRDGDYRIVRVAEDVVAWIDQLDADRVHLVGHDWGAVAAYAVASLAPERLLSVCTLAIPPLGRLPSRAAAHAPALGRLWYIGMFQVPRLPERALLARDGALIRWLWSRWSPGWTCPAADLDRVVDVLAQPGVARATLGYYRALGDVVSADGRAGWRLVGAPASTPTLVLAGERDGCMDASLFASGLDPQAFTGGVRLEQVAGAGHFLHQERPRRINELLLGWIAEHGG